MECNEQEKVVKQKAEFYFQEKTRAHVLLIPKPKFINGLFTSDLIEQGNYYWFLPDKTSIPQKLFLFEIFDVKDYEDKGREKDE